MTSLKKLDLSCNLLSDLPEGFCNLIKLKHLNLHQNELKELPQGELKELPPGECVGLPPGGVCGAAPRGSVWGCPQGECVGLPFISECELTVSPP